MTKAGPMSEANAQRGPRSALAIGSSSTLSPKVGALGDAAREHKTAFYGTFLPGQGESFHIGITIHRFDNAFLVAQARILDATEG